MSYWTSIWAIWQIHRVSQAGYTSCNRNLQTPPSRLFYLLRAQSLFSRFLFKSKSPSFLCKTWTQPAKSTRKPHPEVSGDGGICLPFFGSDLWVHLMALKGPKLFKSLSPHLLLSNQQTFSRAVRFANCPEQSLVPGVIWFQGTGSKNSISNLFSAKTQWEYLSYPGPKIPCPFKSFAWNS